MSTYIISDIHLGNDTDANSNLLLEFLHTKGPTADAIYILGDLFAMWLGDDTKARYSDDLIAALKSLSSQQVPLYFMRGNRDFLVGKKFCQATGCKLLPDPCTISLYNDTVLLTHGDLLCTKDRNYQKFRRTVQNPLIKAVFLALPLGFRKKLGTFVKVKTNTKSKNLDIYDAVQDTVDQWFAKFNVTKMIHGHTHKAAVHNHNGNTRFVLGDWNVRGTKILVCDTQNYELRTL